MGQACRGPAHTCNPSTKESRGRGSPGPVGSLPSWTMQAPDPARSSASKGKRWKTRGGHRILSSAPPPPCAAQAVVHSHLMQYIHIHMCTHKVKFYKSLSKLKNKQELGNWEIGLGMLSSRGVLGRRLGVWG